MATHYFTSTGAAYDAAMCSDDINEGDILIVESEKVIGLAYTWPIAVTIEAGQFHQAKQGYSLTHFGFSIETIQAAKNEARIRGFSLLHNTED